MLQIIVDAPYGTEAPLVHRTSLMNLVLASKQKGFAKAYAIECGLEDGDWLLVSPVYFHTTHRDVLMIADGFSKELDDYYQIFSQFVKADGWVLHRALPHLWLIKAPNMPKLDAAPLFEIAHQSLKPFLDVWPKQWRTWFTEIQMLFETHQAKEVNGVWVWGSGEYQSVPLILTYEPQMRLKKHDIILMNACDTPILLASHRQIHWWWQDLEFIQKPPSLWKRFKQWVTHGN